MQQKSNPPIWNRFFLGFLLIATFLTIPLDMAEAKVVIYSFKEKAKKADIIIIGKVVSVQTKYFSENVALVSIDEAIFGDLKSKEIKIKFGRKNIFFAKEDTTLLKDDEKYVFFLKMDESVYRIIGTNQGYYHIRDDNMVSRDTKQCPLEEFIKEIRKALSE